MFGRTVSGFGSKAKRGVVVAAPDSAVIKSPSGFTPTSDNVDYSRYDQEEESWVDNYAVVPRDVGSTSGYPLLLTEAPGMPIERFIMIKTVNGTIATHAWTAVITNTVGSGAEWDGLSSATATSATSGTFTTPAIDGNTISMNGFDPADAGYITFNYTATNAGGSDAATEVKVYWVAGG